MCHNEYCNSRIPLFLEISFNYEIKNYILYFHSKQSLQKHVTIYFKHLNIYIIYFFSLKMFWNVCSINLMVGSFWGREGGSADRYLWNARCINIRNMNIINFEWICVQIINMKCSGDPALGTLPVLVATYKALIQSCPLI